MIMLFSQMTDVVLGMAAGLWSTTLVKARNISTTIVWTISNQSPQRMNLSSVIRKFTFLVLTDTSQQLWDAFPWHLVQIDNVFIRMNCNEVGESSTFHPVTSSGQIYQ